MNFNIICSLGYIFTTISDAYIDYRVTPCHIVNHKLVLLSIFVPAIDSHVPSYENGPIAWSFPNLSLGPSVREKDLSLGPGPFTTGS